MGRRVNEWEILPLHTTWQNKKKASGRYRWVKVFLTQWKSAFRHWKNSCYPAMMQKPLLLWRCEIGGKVCDGVREETGVGWQALCNIQRQSGVGLDVELERWDKRERRQVVRGKVSLEYEDELKLSEVVPMGKGRMWRREAECRTWAGRR